MPGIGSVIPEIVTDLFYYVTQPFVHVLASCYHCFNTLRSDSPWADDRSKISQNL